MYHKVDQPCKHCFKQKKLVCHSYEIFRIGKSIETKQIGDYRGGKRMKRNYSMGICFILE